MHHTRSATLYDAIYAAVGKDYERETRALHDLIQRMKQSTANTLLDVACGTGAHLRLLQQDYTVAGLDSDAAMIAVAQRQMPSAPFYQADMADFALHQQFAVITCLFGSIGYVQTLPRLAQTFAAFHQHLLPGGVAIVEPWLDPSDFQPGRVGMVVVDQPELQAVRMHRTEQVGAISRLVFHYLVGAAGDVEYFTEQHDLGLFPPEAYSAACAASGLQPHVIEGGLTGRGVLVGIKAGA